MIPWLLLLSILFLLVTLKSCEANDQLLVFRYHECNEERGNFTDGSDTYPKNRDAVLKEIHSDKEIDYGFYNFSYGEDPDKVNAIGLCRGDIKPEECRGCLKERCRVQKEAIGYYDLCILRYSPDPIFGVMETQTSKVHITNNANNTGVMFDLSGLLNRLKTTAADGDSRWKFAEDSALPPASSSSSSNGYNETIYALLQCTPDLSEQNCTRCFDSAFSDISFWCASKGKKGWMYLGPSCTVRYENTSFYESIVVVNNNTVIDAPAAPPQLPSKLPPSGSTKGRKSKTGTVIAIVVIICIYLRARKRRHYG